MITQSSSNIVKTNTDIFKDFSSDINGEFEVNPSRLTLQQWRHRVPSLWIAWRRFRRLLYYMSNWYVDRQLKQMLNRFMVWYARHVYIHLCWWNGHVVNVMNLINHTSKCHNIISAVTTVQFKSQWNIKSRKINHARIYSLWTWWPYIPYSCKILLMYVANNHKICGYLVLQMTTLKTDL